MSSLPWTPIMVSCVRNGVPIPVDWDGDLIEWAMSAHLPDRVNHPEAPAKITAHDVAHRYTKWSVYYLCVSQEEVDAIFREFDPRGYCTDEIETDAQIEKWRKAEGGPYGVRIVRRSLSSD